MAKDCEHDARRLYDQLIESLREVAKSLGYALAVHGTLKRDIDLIAIPWTPEAVSQIELAEAIRAKAEEIVGYAPPHPLEVDEYFQQGCKGLKPHGRRSWSYHLTPNCDGAYIDLSVMQPWSGEIWEDPRLDTTCDSKNSSSTKPIP
jgi:hypothetical protein